MKFMAGRILLVIALATAGGNCQLNFSTALLSHPEFNFDVYGDIASLQTKQPYRLEIRSSIDLYYSHVFTSLKSPYVGNLTQIKFLRVETSVITLQTWRYSNNTLTLRHNIPVLPKGQITTVDMPAGIDVEIGDMIGFWVNRDYPIGMIVQDTTDSGLASYLVSPSPEFILDKKPTVGDEFSESASGMTFVRALGKSYIPALQAVVEYEESNQPSTTASPTTTATYTATVEITTDANELTSETLGSSTQMAITEPTAEIQTTTLSPSISTVKPREDNSTTGQTKPSSNSTAKNMTTPTDTNLPPVEQSPQKPLTGLDETTKYVIIGVAVAVFIIIVVMITFIILVCKKQKQKAKKIAELKKSYEASNKTYHGGEVIDAEEYQYPNPQIYRTDTLNKDTYAQIRKPKPVMDNQSDHYYEDEYDYDQVGTPTDEQTKKHVTMEDNDLYEPMNSLSSAEIEKQRIQLFENELYTPC